MRDYGLKPWEMELLTGEELNEILRDQNERHAAIAKANKAANQPRRR